MFLTLGLATLGLAACGSAGEQPEPTDPEPTDPEPTRPAPMPEEPSSSEPSAEPVPESSPGDDGQPHQTVELVVRARLLRSDQAPAHCGYLHFAAAREYEVLEVLEGTWPQPRVYALESCPSLAPPLLPAGALHLELSEESPSGLSIIDNLGHPDMQRFYIVRATPEMPGSESPTTGP